MGKELNNASPTLLLERVDRAGLEPSSDRRATGVSRSGFGVSRLDGPRVSVIIPALNEADNLRAVLPRLPHWVHEVILVDGNSTDETQAVAREIVPDILIITQSGTGKGAALRQGFAAASGEIIVMLDADGSTAPEEIPAYVGLLLAGADFVKGSRFLQGGGTADMPFYRKFGNGAFVLLVRMLFGGTYSDLCYGYNAFWKSSIFSLDLDADGFEIEAMMNIRALKAGLKVAEVPSFEDKRIYGSGRLRTIPDGWRVLKQIISEWHCNGSSQAIVDYTPLRLASADSLPEPSLAKSRN